MVKGKIVLYVAIAFLYFLILSFLRWRFSFSWEILFFVFGGILGSLLLDLDYFLHVFYTRPEDPCGEKARELSKRKDYIGVIREIWGIREKCRELVLHSAFFGPVLFVLTVFVLTSSGSFFGAGLVLGLFLRYIFETLSLSRKNPVLLKERLFWQFGEMDLKTQNIFLLLSLLAFIFSSALFFR